MGFGTALYLFVWLAGIVFTVGAFIVQPRDQAPLFIMIGLAFLAAAIFWTYYIIVIAPKREAEAAKRAAIAARNKKLAEQTTLEKDQRNLAFTEGLAKFHIMDEREAKAYQEGLNAMRQLGIIMQESVYQEKKHDWAVWGGIADGLAGPAAGISTAIDTMQENARIEIDNAARRKWGQQQNIFYQDLANQLEAKREEPLSEQELQNKYSAILSWHPDTLFSFIKLSKPTIELDPQTGAVNVTVQWTQEDKSICIDGAIRAKIFSANGECVGCAYLVFPKVGTAQFKGTLTGICAQPKESAKYSVKFEPVNLWEFAPKRNVSLRQTDGLTDKQHQQIVIDYDNRFKEELVQN